MPGWAQVFSAPMHWVVIDSNLPLGVDGGGFPTVTTDTGIATVVRLNIMFNFSTCVNMCVSVFAEQVFKTRLSSVYKLAKLPPHSASHMREYWNLNGNTYKAQHADTDSLHLDLTRG